MTNRIYLDNAATTQVDKRVVDAMLPFFSQKYGNASSIHSIGTEAKKAIDSSREIIANSINANKEEIIFTSGGSESNNLVLKSVLEKENPHIITSKIEHSSIMATCRYLEAKGVEITYIDVDKEGFVNPEHIKKAIKENTTLVSIMHANNEIGTIEPIEEIGRICKEKGVLFHTDASQSFTKQEIDVKKMNIDFITLSSHKIYGPKGIGALYAKNKKNLVPLIHGGKHEFGLRAGTENVAGIVGFAKAVEIAINDKEEKDKILTLRNKLVNGLFEKIPNIRLNGPKITDNRRLYNNANISFINVEGEGILARLDLEGIEVSTGSACSSKDLKASHVLLACGLPHEIAHGAIRFSLGRFTTKEDIDYALEIVPKVIRKLREISSMR